MSTTVDLTKTYSREAKSKVLAVRLTPNESEYVSEIAHDLGFTLSDFTREALQKHINSLLNQSC